MPTTNGEFDGTNTTESRRRKGAAIGKLLGVSPHGEKASQHIVTYIDAASQFPAEIFERACELLIANWTDTYRPPAPGNVCSACKILEQRSKGEQQRILQAAQIDHQRRNAITIDRATAEISRLEALPPGADPYPPPGGDEMGPEFHDRVKDRVLSNLFEFIERQQGRGGATKQAKPISNPSTVGDWLGGDSTDSIL